MHPATGHPPCTHRPSASHDQPEAGPFPPRGASWDLPPTQLPTPLGPGFTQVDCVLIF